MLVVQPYFWLLFFCFWYKTQSVTLNCAAMWATSIKAIALSAGSRVVFNVGHAQLHVCVSLSFITQFDLFTQSKKRTGLGKKQIDLALENPIKYVIAFV